MLDSGPLGLLVYPKGLPEAHNCNQWLERLISGGQRVVVPEIVDYELRRELLRLRLAAGVARLDRLTGLLAYVPISTEMMLLAANLWADVRHRGLPTADPQALDVDVILAAQAQSLATAASPAVVATTNVGHLSRLVEARRWPEIS